jgi:hypothetical protein
VQAYEAEIGEELTEVEKGLVKQAAALTLQAEQMQADIVNGKPVDSDVLIRISGTAKRLIAEIADRAGKRKPEAPAQQWQDFLASQHAATTDEGDG